MFLYMSENQPSLEDIAAQEERQHLREESEAVIAALNNKNIESLTKGESRVGYRIGEGDTNTFVLNVPVVVDANGSRYHHYVALTTEGIRALRFNKGRVDESGALILNNPGGLSLDSNYQDSEHAFRWALEEHAASWDDKQGERKATAVFRSGSNLQYTLPGAEGGWYPQAENGGLHVAANGSERFRIREHVWDDQHPEIMGLIADVPEEMVNEAVQKSIEAAKTSREVKITPISQQRNTLRSLTSLLAA
jgi:hypothetical protein